MIFPHGTRDGFLAFLWLIVAVGGMSSGLAPLACFWSFKWEVSVKLLLALEAILHSWFVVACLM